MFSKEKVNTGRQIELDLARGLAGLFMIFIHAQEIFANRAVIDSPFGVFNDFVSTVPAAPVFMFLMGLGIVYSRKSEPKNYYKRGAMLLLGGYLLNTLRGLLPNLYQAWARPQAADDYVAQAVSTFFYIDILAFAGLALMTFGAIKQFRLGAGAVAVLAIGLGLLNLVLPNDIENPVLSVFFGLFWGADAISFFPYLRWIFYPLAGWLFGSLFIRTTDKNRFYACFGGGAVAVALLLAWLFYDLLEIPDGLSEDYAYYQQNLADNLVFTAMVVAELALLHFVGRFIPRIFNSTISRWSRNVTAIYFVHWIILNWTLALLPHTAANLDMTAFVGLLAAVIVASDVLAALYQRWKSAKAT